MLSDEDKPQVDEREEGDADGPGAEGDVIKRNAVRNRQKLWKTRVVPYRISPALCKYISNQWVVFLARSDWRLKLGMV